MTKIKKDDDAVVVDTELFDNAIEDGSEEGTDAANEEDLQPAYGSELWHDYVMRQFRDDELMDGAPTCDGCRRVIEEVIGPIAGFTIKSVTPPSLQNNGTATVVVSVSIAIQNESHPLYGAVVTCDEVADVNKDNCDHPYHKYASATAASRAEGRALRKMLRLRNVATAEEVSEKAEIVDADCDWAPDEPITDSQISVIDMMCKRLDMNVMEFVNSGKRAYEDIEVVTKSVAQRMIQELNKVQRNVKPKPTTVGAYVAGWRPQPK